jgi:hypothetical protein
LARRERIAPPARNLTPELPERRQVVFEAVLEGGDVRLPPLAAGGRVQR